MTPHAGQGGNAGIQSVVALTNELFALLRKDRNPDTAALTEAFQAYQETRSENIKGAARMSASMARTMAWENWMHWFIDRYWIPLRGGDEAMTDKKSAPLCADGLVLSFADEPGFKEGKVPWRNRPRGSKIEGNGI
jgi:hypothetical protein